MRTLIVSALTLCFVGSAYAQTGPGSANGKPAEPQPAAAAPADAPVSIDMTLREAYKREFAFLAGQRSQLAQRLKRVESTSDQEARSIQGSISQLESELLRLEDRTKALQEEFTLAEQAQQSSSDDKQLVDSTLDQSQSTLKDYGIEAKDFEEGDAKDQLLKTRFESAIQLLNKLSSVYTEQGEFFLQDGTKTEGTIVRVGRIAAYGSSDAGAGVLAPAGGGKLKVWRDAAPDDAKAMVAGNSGETLAIFLYESLDARVDDADEETPVEHVASGGAIAWVIVGLGIFGLLLAAVRALLLMASSSNTAQLEKQVGELVRADRLDEAVDVCKNAKGAAARVLANVLARLKTGGDDDIDDVVAESVLKENRNIHRFNAIILVIAGVAPLLGLLGTVTGMISTFDVITKFGTGDPKMLSGGISTALVTTELGLIVAIPTLLLGNLLRGWGDGIENEVDRVTLRIVNIYKDVHGNDQKAA